MEMVQFSCVCVIMLTIITQPVLVTSFNVLLVASAYCKVKFVMAEMTVETTVMSTIAVSNIGLYIGI